MKSAIRRIALVMMAIGLAASCSVPDRDADCLPVEGPYRRVFESGLVTGRSFQGDVVSHAAAFPGTWYVVARVGEATPVWVTDRDPRGDVLGDFIDANRAAQQLSQWDFVKVFRSHSEMAAAAGDPERIATAQRCPVD